MASPKIMDTVSIYGDEYYTLEKDAEAICDCLAIDKGEKIWLPFNDAGKAFDRVLTARGYNVVCTDGDFFVTDPPEGCKIIVSNPPFSRKKEVLKRGDALGMKFALVMPFLFLNDGVPLDYGDQIVLFRKRIHFVHADFGELNKPRTNCFVLSNGLLKQDLIIVR